MAVPLFIPNFQLSESSEEDEGEDCRNPKITGKVLRVYDSKKETFKRLRIRNKDRNVPTLGSLNKTANVKLKKDEKKPKEGGKKGAGMGKNVRGETSSFSPVSEKVVAMTPTNRYGRKSFEENTPRRKRSTGDNLPNLSSSMEDDVIPESPEIQERKIARKLKANSPAAKGSGSGVTPKSKFSRKSWTPTPNFKNGKTPSPKKHRQNKSPAYLDRNKKGSPNAQRGKWKSGKRNETPGQKKSQNRRTGPTIADQTPEFMRVKDEDSVKQEKKERRRKRHVVMCKKTKRGQPVMRGRIELMLEKIKADLGHPS